MKLSYKQQYLLEICNDAVEYYDKKYKEAVLYDQQQLKILEGQDKINQDRLIIQIAAIKADTNFFTKLFRPEWKYRYRAILDLDLPRERIYGDCYSYTLGIKKLADDYILSAPKIKSILDDWKVMVETIKNCEDSVFWLTSEEFHRYAEFIIEKGATV